jgi:hypothetical protein
LKECEEWCEIFVNCTTATIEREKKLPSGRWKKKTLLKVLEEGKLMVRGKFGPMTFEPKTKGTRGTNGNAFGKIGKGEKVEGKGWKCRIVDEKIKLMH